MAFVELCERFTYYGVSTLFQNYTQNSSYDRYIPGAIGLGQAGATLLSYFWQFWCYVCPIIGAIIADQYLGKYKTILVFSVIYFVGLVILELTAFPMAIKNGAALGGLVTAMVIVGLVGVS